MSKSLEAVFDVVPTPAPIKNPVEIVNPVNDDNDYGYARDNLVEFIEKGKGALDDAIRIMQMSEHPRAVEVVSGLLKNMADINKQLLELKKANKEIKEPSRGAGTPGQPAQIAQQTNNSIFVGNSADLAKLLSGIDGQGMVIDNGQS